jgi:hypothetical protein
MSATIVCSFSLGFGFTLANFGRRTLFDRRRSAIQSVNLEFVDIEFVDI